MTDPDRIAAIDAMLVKDALYEIAMRYCRAIDRRDPEMLRALYHVDAIDEHGVVFSGGIDAFIDAQPALMDRFEVTAHHISNTSYRIAGDKADGELYFTAYHRTLDEKPQHVVVHGRYLDNYERRAGHWRIVHRRLVWDSFITLDVAPTDDAQLRGLGIVGAGANDLSYHALPLMGHGQ